MKKIILFSILISYFQFSYGQNSLQSTQGVWVEDTEGFDSYIVIENHNWYSITILEGVIDVSKELFGFYDDFEAERINPKDLNDSGRYVVFLTYRSSIKDYNTNIKRGYYSFFEFDLNKDYFTYYANEPVVLTKIKALPNNVKKIFEKEKTELENKFIFFEHKE